MAIPYTFMKAALSRFPMSDYLMYGAYDDERGVYRMIDGRVGAVWMMPPLTGLSDAAVKGLGGLYAMDLPQGSTIQIHHHGSPVIEPALEHYVALRNNAGHGSTTYRDAQRFEDYYLRARDTRLIASTGVRPRDCNVYVSVTIPLEGELPDGMKLEMIWEKLNGIEKLLESCGFYPRRVGAYELLCLLHQLLNPGHRWADRPVTYDKQQLLKLQAVRLDTKCQLSPTAIYLDNWFAKSLTVQQFPEEWNGSRNRDLIGSLTRLQDQITCPYWITLNVVRYNTIKIGAEITRNHTLVTNQAVASGIIKLIPIIGKKKKGFDLMVDAISEGSQPIGMYYQVVLYGEDASTLEQHSQSVQSLYRSQEWMLQEDTFIGFPLFMFSLPMALPPDVQLLRDKLRRLKTVPTSVPGEIAPVVGDWKGLGAPLMIFTSRCGQIMGFDLFANPTGNFNCCVAAKSGAGKSFWANEMIRAYLGTQGRVWMIDAGKSYEKLCEHLKGQFVQFAKNRTQFCLNPMSLLDVPVAGRTDSEVKDERQERISMVKDLIGQMISPSKALSDWQSSRVQEAIIHVMNKGDLTKATPTDVMEVLKEMKDQHGRTLDLANMLQPYCKGGNFGEMFNGKNNVNFNETFVVLELDGLDQLPELRSVILLQLVMNIQSAMYMGDRGQRKILGIDEAWDLLKQEGDQVSNVSAFFNKAVRRVRKYNGSTLPITQGVNDFYDVMGSTGKALMENSDFVILLQQKAESLMSLKKNQRLILSEYEFDLLQSVHRGDGYSEMMFLGPTGRGIGRLSVPRETQLTYSTNAVELKKIEVLKSSGMTTEEAIAKIVEDEKNQALKKGLKSVA
ncbi:MAG: type IV secretion system protein TraC [Nitrospirota bacterium]|jgi:conjugal transfer ATP-binding protein TraC